MLRRAHRLDGDPPEWLFSRDSCNRLDLFDLVVRTSVVAALALGHLYGLLWAFLTLMPLTPLLWCCTQFSNSRDGVVPDVGVVSVPGAGGRGWRQRLPVLVTT